MNLKNLISKLRASLVDVRDDYWMLSDTRFAAGQTWPVQSAHRQRNINPFFLLGHPRSGTTLLRAILSRHPLVFIPPENGGLARMIRVFGSLRSAPWETVVSTVVEKFAKGYEFKYWSLDPNELTKRAIALDSQRRTLADLISILYESYGEMHAPGKTIWGDKTTPGHFHYLRKLQRVFPCAAYVHIVRDGRDCVASCVKAGFFGAEYQLAAQAWRHNVAVCRKFGTKLPGPRRFLEIRYEDLIASTQEEVERLCAFLQLQMDNRMLDHTEGVTQRIPDVTTVPHHANVAKAIFTDSIGSWDREIPRDHVGGVLRIVESELRNYGYR